MRTLQVVALLIVALDLWALFDILRRPVDLGDKVLWLLIVWLFPLLGFVLYLFLGRPYLARSERMRLSHR